MTRQNSTGQYCFVGIVLRDEVSSGRSGRGAHEPLDVHWGYRRAFVQFYIRLQVFGDAGATAAAGGFLLRVGIPPSTQQRLLQAHICQLLVSGHCLAKVQGPCKNAFRQRSLMYRRPLRFQSLLRKNSRPGRECSEALCLDG